MPNNITFTSPTFDNTTAWNGQAISGGRGTFASALTTSTTWTIECRIKQSGTPSAVQVVLGAASYGYLGLDTTGHIQGNTTSPAVNLLSPSTYGDGNWHHLEFSSGPSGAVLFVDGVQVAATATATGGLATPWQLKNFDGAGAFPFSGEVDEIAFWSIQKHAPGSGSFTPSSSPYVGNEPGIVALYHLDGNGTDSATSTTNITFTSPTFDSTTAWNGQAISGGRGTFASALTTSTTWTMECRIKQSGIISATQVVLGASSYGYLGLDPTGHIQGNTMTPAVDLLSSSTYGDGNWHHLEFSSGLSGAVLFVDGVQVAATATATGGLATPWQLRNFDGAGAYPFSGEVDEIAFWNIQKHAPGSGSFTPSNSPYVGNEPGIVALYHLDGNGINSATPTTSTTIAANNAAIYYSPGNWYPKTSPVEAVAYNGGAYFRVMFTGVSCALTTNMATNTSPYPVLLYRIDTAPWQTLTLTSASSYTLTLPSGSLSSGTLFPVHYLEVIVKDFQPPTDLWAANNPSAFHFTGLTLAAGGAVSAPATKAISALWFGDSITAGSQLEDISFSAGSANGGYSIAGIMREMLGIEIGTVGFGGSGYTVPSSYGVPAFDTSYLSYASGLPRTWPNVDLIVINHGTNDNDVTAVRTAAVTVVSDLLTKCPNAKIVLLSPLPEVKPHPFTNLQAVPALTNPTRVFFVDNQSLTTAHGVGAGNYHPSGANIFGFVAPSVANQLRKYLPPPPRWTYG